MFNGIIGNRNSSSKAVWRTQNGQDWRPRAQVQRREQLVHIMDRGAGPRVRLSETFDKPDALMAVLETEGLEGIVSKRKHSPYISGVACGWIKSKTQSWKAAHRDRFRKRSSSSGAG